MKLSDKLYELANLRTLSNEINKEFSENEYFKDFKCKIEHGNLIIIDKIDNSVFLKGVPETRLTDDILYTTKIRWFDTETEDKLVMSPAVYGKPGNGTYEKAITVIKEIIKDVDEQRKLREQYR